MRVGPVAASWPPAAGARQDRDGGGGARRYRGGDGDPGRDGSDPDGGRGALGAVASARAVVPGRRWSTSSATSSAVWPAVLTTMVAASVYASRRCATRVRNRPSTSPASSGRTSEACTRRAPSAASTSRKTTAWSTSAARVAGWTGAPPPSARTPSCSVSSRVMVACSRSRKAGSPAAAKISGMERPVMRSTSVSASRNGSARRSARSRPTVDLLAPGGPTSTMRGLRTPARYRPDRGRRRPVSAAAEPGSRQAEHLR